MLLHNRLYLSLAIEPVGRYRWKPLEADVVRILAALPLRDFWQFGRNLGIARSRLWRPLAVAGALKLVTKFHDVRWRVLSRSIARTVALLKVELAAGVPAKTVTSSKSAH
jgi:hypothetical protein